MERRTVIAVLGGGTIGLLLPYAFYRYLSGGVHPYLGVKDYLSDGPQAALRAITPTSDFYVMTSRSTPNVDAAAWSLAMDGLVEQPLRFSYDEIRRLPRYETHLTLECISNNVGGGYIGNAQWAGTLLKPLVERAQPKQEATRAVFHAAEGYTSSHPVSVLLRDGVFLCWEMNEEPLTRAHGFPLRVFIPGKYGMKMPKWLTRIEFVNYEHLGYWEWQGWSNTADRQLRAVFDDPRAGNQISGESFLITGYAVADASGVARVEISFDDGDTWRPAEVFSNPIPSQMWAFWKYEWKNPPPGKHEIRVRAVDRAGRVQTADRSTGEWPSGATGHHSVTVRVS
jgi:DMSO/TMAO reductase YedYZ molybdopterin-dependent catalytic subunit